MTRKARHPLFHHPKRTMTAALVGAVLGTVQAGTASRCLAADGGAARADELFARGKELMAQGDYAQACPVLAESYATDAATGALLALAVCHERQGKLASAVRTYLKVIERAGQDGREDRRDAARERVATLGPQLSTIAVQLPPSESPLEVRLDGATLTSSQLGMPLGVDGGVHRIEAIFEHAQTFSTEVSVGDHGEATVVEVSSPEVTAPSAPVEPRPTMQRQRNPRLTTGQIAGLVTLGASAVSLGVASVFGIIAVNKNDTSQSNCNADLCTEHGREQRIAARHAGDGATAALLAAGALAVVGAAVFFDQRRKDVPADYAAAIWATPNAAGAAVHGAF